MRNVAYAIVLFDLWSKRASTHVHGLEARVTKMQTSKDLTNRKSHASRVTSPRDAPSPNRFPRPANADAEHHVDHSGATVGLAALVSYQRGSAGDVRLVDPITYRGATVQLPKGWTIAKTADELSSVLLTATEPKRDNNGDEDSGGRILRVVREPLASYRAPIEYALSRFHYRETDPKVIEGKNYMAIGGSPGELLFQNREVAPKVASRSDVRRRAPGQDHLRRDGCAFRAWRGDRTRRRRHRRSAHIDLVKRIAAALKLADEPSLIDSGEVKLPSGVSAPIPADFSAIKQDDPLVMPHTLRGKNINGPMRTHPPSHRHAPQGRKRHAADDALTNQRRF